MLRPFSTGCYHPSYSKISNAERRSLLSKLEQILAETTRDNSSESVGRVFSLLLHRGQKSDFISAYREEFRTACEEVRRKVPAKSWLPSGPRMKPAGLDSATHTPLDFCHSLSTAGIHHRTPKMAKVEFRAVEDSAPAT